MKRFGLFCLLGFVWLAAGCESAPDGYQVPTQSFARPLEGGASETGRLFGRVVFPSEYSQRSVVFEIAGRRFVAAPDGRFVVEDIPVGTQTLRISVKSYEFISREVEIKAEGYAQAGTLTLRMARGKVIGRLVNDKGKSAPHVAVRLAPLGDVARTDQDGIFQFIGVNAGAHVLDVTDEQFFTYNRRFRLDSGERRNLGNIKVFRRATASTLPHAAVVIRTRGPVSAGAEKTD